MTEPSPPAAPAGPTEGPAAEAEPVLPPGTVVSVQKLKRYFELKKSFFGSMRGEQVYVHAVDGVSFDLAHGEILGLVGESGCGKTTTGRLISRLETPTEGRILFQGADIAALTTRELFSFRRELQMIFQDPYESLNPRFSVLRAVSEPLMIHRVVDSREQQAELVIHALEDSGLRPGQDFLDRFPHELSGGQRQRVSIARAIVLNPKVIIADEPVSMLDVSIRAGVMNLMLDLREKYQIPYVFITHDIAVARYMSDRIAVMYLGRIVETGKTEDVILKPTHPYTRALLSAVPIPDPEHVYSQVPIRGELPSPIDLPSGCRFRTRCLLAQEICATTAPPNVEVAPGHTVECHFAQDIFDGRLSEPPIQERVAVEDVAKKLFAPSPSPSPSPSPAPAT